MRYQILFICLMLAGCAHDNYTVLPDSAGSKGAMASDLHDCKMEAIKKYNDSKPDQTAGALIGGAMGGVVGGVIGGSIAGAGFFAGSQPRPEMSVSEINPYVEKCMLQKGYTGTSS